MLIALMLSACGGKSLTDTDYIRNAKELQQQNKLEASVIQLKNAIKFNPQNSEARWLLGLIYSDLAKWQSSEKELSAALRLGVSETAIFPSLSQVLLNQGKYQQIIEQIQIKQEFGNDLKVQLHSIFAEAYLGLDDKGSAEQSLAQAISIDPSSVFVRLAQVNQNIYDKDYKQAYQLLQAIIKEDPNHYRAWLLKGMVEGKLGQNIDAISSYTNVIENSETLALTAYLYRSLLFVKGGEYAKAKLDLEKLEAMAPNHPRLFFTKGLLALKKQKFVDARTNFENALKYSPDSLETLLFLGGVYFELGNLEQAEKNLNKVTLKNPENLYAKKLLAKVLVGSNKLARARQVIEPVLKKMPEDPSVALMFGKIMMGLGEMDQALPPLQKAFMLQWDEQGRSNFIGAVSEQATIESMIGQYPENIQSQILLILAYQRVNDISQASTEADKFIALYPESALPYTLKGMVQVMQKEFEAASKSFNVALKNNEADPLASLHYGKLLISQNKVDQAETVFLSSLQKYKHHPLILPQIANIAAKSGRFEQAQKYLATWVKNSPNSLEARLALVNFLLQSRKPFKALEMLRKPPQLNLDNVFALKFLGDIYMAINAPSSAISSYGKIIGAQPGSPIGYYLLAKAYERLGDSVKAKHNLKKALEADSNHTPSSISLAHFYISEGDIDKAGKIISSILVEETNADFLVLQGRYSLAKGENESALKKYREALDISNSPKAAIQLAKAHYTIGQVNEGVKVLQSWLHNNPKNINVRYILADTLLQIGDSQLAKEEYKKIVEIEPAHVLALNNLAYLEVESDVQKALEYAQKAYLFAPEQAEILDTYGVVLLKAGQIESALEKLQKAYDKKPGNLDIVFSYARALIANNKSEKAKDILEQAIIDAEAAENKSEPIKALQEIKELLATIKQ